MTKEWCGRKGGRCPFLSKDCKNCSYILKQGQKKIEDYAADGGE